MTYYRVNSPNVIHEIIDGEAVLVNMENGSYYSIDSVGAVVWDYIEKGLSNRQIVQAISNQYAGNQEEISTGIEKLIDDLKTERLIVPGEPSSEHNHAAAINQAIPAVPKPEFVPPVLNKYTDMEDLLLLDPIHDVDETGWPNTNPSNAGDA
jgi:DNA-binding NarL/FixJ family response regulator